MKIREVSRIVQGVQTTDGAGVKLVRVLGKSDIKDFDPFLMLDAFGSENPEDYIKGFPMHPHRGIETITYLLEGKVNHLDSLGNGGTLSGGELQWMTAGSGILHEEMPQETKKLEGLQFWLNLPQKDKMAPPSYFPISSHMIKEIELEQGNVKLIAGEFLGERGIEPKYVKATMMDVTLHPSSEYHIPIPSEQKAFLYILDGMAQFGEKATLAKKHSAVLFNQGDVVRVSASKEGIRFVLLAGKPLEEPIAWGGPIVMNTQEELELAFSELEKGTFIKHK